FVADARTRTALAISATGVVLGIAILVVGATTPYRRLVDAHVAASAVGVVLLLAHSWSAAGRPTSLASGFCRTVVLAASGARPAAATAAAIAHGGREARWRAAYHIQNPTTPPATMDDEGAGAASPFFPSSANTNVNGIIPANFFMTSASCGRCHRDIY